MEEYRDYLNKWLGSLREEIEFWDDFMANEGGDFFAGFYETIDPNRTFALDEDIPDDMKNQLYRFIDVGSGPFSRCGQVTNKVKLVKTCVDPLADVYNTLKEKYNINNGAIVTTGFVEMLEMQFAPNSFDMVHMSNSLDHSFYAIDGIWQLLNICKVGGKVILRHSENVAEEADYQGLHQWNLSLHNPENSFIVWRGSERYDICEMFRPYADIELYPNVCEDGVKWIYNKVVMIKRKDVKLPKNKYYDEMLGLVYQHFIRMNMNVVWANILFVNQKEHFHRRIIDKIRKIFHNREHTIEKLEQHKFNRCVIYGMAAIGSNLRYLLNECGKTELILLDRRGKQTGFDAIPLEEWDDLDVDVVIVTVNSDEVYKALANRVGKDRVLFAEDFLNLLER